MRVSRVLLVAVVSLVISVGSAMTASVSLQISGPGAVNDSTMKAGEKVSVDIYFTNDTIRTGFTLGFKVTSPDIKAVVHVPDSGNGLNNRGDVKGHGGWEAKEVWDLYGVFAVEVDWDGVLPDLLGFGGLAAKQIYGAHELDKKLSFDIVVPETGTLVIDSSFYPPGGKWMYSSPPGVVPSHYPEWGGPYTYKVIK